MSILNDMISDQEDNNIFGDYIDDGKNYCHTSVTKSLLNCGYKPEFKNTNTGSCWGIDIVECLECIKDGQQIYRTTVYKHGGGYYKGYPISYEERSLFYNFLNGSRNIMQYIFEKSQNLRYFAYKVGLSKLKIPNVDQRDEFNIFDTNSQKKMDFLIQEYKDNKIKNHAYSDDCIQGGNINVHCYFIVNVLDSKDCFNCVNCLRCNNCINCDDCIDCENITGGKWMYKNKQLSHEEWVEHENEFRHYKIDFGDDDNSGYLIADEEIYKRQWN